MLSSVWIQTAPLFRSPYLFSTILVCTVQFGIYFTSNGFYMFFADILNRMASNLDNFTEPRLSMCEIINMKSINRTSFQHNDNNATTLPDQVSLCVIIIFFVISIITQNGIVQICTTKLELRTLEQGIILELTYAFGFVLISFIINATGKFPILCEYNQCLIETNQIEQFN